MPEAIEAVLTRGSRVQPRVALLKPISAAVSIGSGGPFGAEGPIIMTGGAVDSVLAQLLHMSADERKTLLVAGAASGMAATFNAPLAAVPLAVDYAWTTGRVKAGDMMMILAIETSKWKYAGMVLPWAAEALS
jgi:CIC family chloride channel protein